MEADRKILEKKIGLTGTYGKSNTKRNVTCSEKKI